MGIEDFVDGDDFHRIVLHFRETFSHFHRLEKKTHNGKCVWSLFKLWFSQLMLWKLMNVRSIYEKFSWWGLILINEGFRDVWEKSFFLLWKKFKFFLSPKISCEKFEKFFEKHFVHLSKIFHSISIPFLSAFCVFIIFCSPPHFSALEHLPLSSSSSSWSLNSTKKLLSSFSLFLLHSENDKS